MRYCIVFLFTVAILLGSTMSSYSQDDYWKEPLEKEIKMLLIDPNSAIFEYRTKPTEKTEEGVSGFLRVNSKNRFGGYTGWSVCAFTVLKNGYVESLNCADKTQPERHDMYALIEERLYIQQQNQSK